MNHHSVDPKAATLDERILVLAPVGRDAPLLCQVLGRAGLAAFACGEMDELVREMQDGVGALLLTEEALKPQAVSDLITALSSLPSWSDLPVVLLAGADAGGPTHGPAIAALRSAGNLTVLERPMGGLTLVTAIQAALRARRRQYESRDLVESEHAARQEAETASHLKDEFLATVSHELRTPLSAILLWIRLLSQGRLGKTEVQHALEAVERSAEAQSRVIEDLLDVSRMMSGKLHLNLQDADLGPIVQAALAIVRLAAVAKHIQLDAVLAKEIGLVLVDPERIQQVLLNLLSNAIKFTPKGGGVSLRLWREDDQVCIEVADTGKGIDAKFLPHVFERFRQAEAGASRRQGGLGLGLAIGRQLVELHGGSIHADSPGEGLGAVFTVKLLASDADLEAEEASPRSQEPDSRERWLDGVRVLLAEDDADTREAMVCTLEQYGAEVTAVASAGAALNVLSEAGPGERPDVLLSDVAMPGMDGYELLRLVRAIEGERGEPALPAAVITAYTRPEDRGRALEAGFIMHLAKPVEPAQLAAVVKQLARPRGLCAELAAGHELAPPLRRGSEGVSR